QEGFDAATLIGLLRGGLVQLDVKKGDEKKDDDRETPPCTNQEAATLLASTRYEPGPHGYARAIHHQIDHLEHKRTTRRNGLSDREAAALEAWRYLQRHIGTLIEL